MAPPGDLTGVCCCSLATDCAVGTGLRWLGNDRFLYRCVGDPKELELAVLLLMLRWCMGEASSALRSRPAVDELPEELDVGCIS